jgi:hypothetical protein
MVDPIVSDAVEDNYDQTKYELRPVVQESSKQPGT